MRHRRRALAALAAGSLALAIAACSSSSAGHGSTESGLAAAMGSVSGAGPAQRYFEYGDLARLRTLGVLDPAAVHDTSKKLIDPHWAAVVGLGAGSLGPYGVSLAEATGFDLYGVDTAVSIGTPPDIATRFTGALDDKMITGKLTGLGARPRSFGTTKGLSFAGDNQVDLSNRLTLRTNLVNQFDQVVVTATGLAASPNSATLQKVLGGGASLLDTGKYRSIADCLGDVVGAVVMTPTKRGNSSVVAVGVRDPKAATSAQHEVLCVLPADGRHAPVHDAVAKRLAPGASDPTTNSPVSTYVTASQVHDVGALVQAVLTLRPGTAVGYLIRGLQRNETAYWDGSCSVIELAQRRC